MHFKVLVVGTQLGWGEVDELLFPFFCYFDIYPIEQRQEDPRFVFGKVVLEEEFNEFKLANKSRNPNSENEYDKETAEDWAKRNPYIIYEKDQGWGFWRNPQGKGAKWDWYLIGGRWTGFFILKQQTEGLVGIPGLFTESPTDLREADQARKCDIDWEAMRKRAREKAEQYWDEAKQMPESERSPATRRLIFSGLP